MDDVLILMSETFEKNKYGVQIPKPVRKEVFCQVHSVTRAEVFEGGRNGLNPAFQFTIFAGEYSGEAVVEYQRRTFSIYRTYLVPGTDYIELYVERKGGTNGKEEAQP